MNTASLYLKQMELGPMQNYVYLIGDTASREALVVDPAWEVQAIIDAAAEDEMTLVGALVTHTHFDHINGLEALLAHKDMPIYVHRAEQDHVPVASSALRPVEGGTTVTVGGVDIKILHTPGHTPGSQCFLVHEQVVSGDTLFISACGRCDLPGGDAEAMYRSLTTVLMKLDDSTRLLPGHNYAPEPTSTIGNERTQNPYLQCTALEDFLRLRVG